MGPDFIPAKQLSELTTIPLKSIYNASSSARGDLAGILTKCGGRLGCWREDYEAWKNARRRVRNEQLAA